MSISCTSISRGSSRSRSELPSSPPVSATRPVPDLRATDPRFRGTCTINYHCSIIHRTRWVLEIDESMDIMIGFLCRRYLNNLWNWLGATELKKSIGEVRELVKTLQVQNQSADKQIERNNTKITRLTSLHTIDDPIIGMPSDHSLACSWIAIILHRSNLCIPSLA
jgi:hypothetical protein